MSEQPTVQLDNIADVAAPLARGLVEGHMAPVVDPVTGIDQVEQQRIDAELQDDPELRLEALDPTDQARLWIRFMAVNHHSNNDSRIAQATLGSGEADYYVRELTLRPEDMKQGNRLAFDRALNISVRGGHPPESMHVPNTMGLYAAGVRQRTGKTPMLRTMDINMADPSPLPGLTYAEGKAECDELIGGMLDRLYFDDGSKQSQELATYIKNYTTLIAGRNKAQIDDLSRLTANALMRHPGERVVMIVEGGSSHANAWADWSQGLNFGYRLQFEPQEAAHMPNTGLGGLIQRASRTGEQPTAVELDRAMLEVTLHDIGQIYRNRPTRAINSLPDSRITTFAQELSIEDVDRHLNALDAIKQVCAKDFTDEAQRRDEGFRRICQYFGADPKVRALLTEVLAA